MSNQWNSLQRKLHTGGLSRRDFLGQAAALGISGTLAQNALADQPRRGGHLILGLNGGGPGDSLDPAFFNADYMNTVGQQLYDCLTVIDENVKVRPALAESWSTRPGAKEWIFKLRQGVTFHNGKPVTAADVVYSINHHRGTETKSGARALVASIVELKATDKHEIAITLDSGNADMPYILADVHLGIVPEGSKFTDGVGTGAFVLESFEPGVRTRMKRNPNDYRTNRGYVDLTETVAISDTTARLSALLSGSVHLISKLDPSTVTQVDRNPKTQVFNIAGNGYSVFAMYCDTPPYDNLDVRLALKYAIDREAILKTVLRGYGKIGNDHPIASFDPMFAADIPQRPYDPDKARFHFNKAGATAPIVLTAADGAFAGAVDMAQLIQASAAKAGIAIQVNRVPSQGYYGTVWLKNPFCAVYWGGRPTADILLSQAFMSSAPWNQSHWRRPKFDEMLTTARAETDAAKRKQMYQDMQLMIHEDGGELIPVFNNFLDAGAKNLRGFVPTPTRQMSGQRAPEKVWFEA